MIPAITDSNFVLAVLFTYCLILLKIEGQQKAFYSHVKDLYKIIKINEEVVSLLLEGQKELKRSIEVLTGISQKTQVDARVATKFSERANSLASSANIGVAILQRGLTVKKPTQTAEQNLKNRHILTELAKKDDETVDWMEPILSEEEREIVNFARTRNGKS